MHGPTRIFWANLRSLFRSSGTYDFTHTSYEDMLDDVEADIVAVGVGLGRIVALHHRSISTTNPIITNIFRIFGTSVSEATVQPNPCRSATTSPPAAAAPSRRCAEGSSSRGWGSHFHHPRTFSIHIESVMEYTGWCRHTFTAHGYVGSTSSRTSPSARTSPSSRRSSGSRARRWERRRVGQKWGQLQPFIYRCIFTGVHCGPTCIVWASLTPFSLTPN